MKKLLVTLGFVIIVGYAAGGLMLMNNWALVAASHQPLDTTIAAMNAADQHYDVAGGWVFLILGLMLASAWAWITLSGKTRSKKLPLQPWLATLIWAAIVALGAPAYFFGAFANLNSIGDTYADWDMEAAAALERPLYLVSTGAMILFFVLLATRLTSAINRGRPQPRPSSN